MNDSDPVERLRKAEWPAPSLELRARVVAVAVRPRRTAWSDRVWFSRRWRVGLATAAVALVALDYWAVPGSAPVFSVPIQADVQAIEDLARSAGLPDDAAASIARRTLIVTRASAAERASLIPGEDR